MSEQGSTVAPDTPEQARAARLANMARLGLTECVEVPPCESEQAPPDEWEAQGYPTAGATEHARYVAYTGLVSCCEPLRPPICGAKPNESTVARVFEGCSHKAPPVVVEVVTEADVLAALGLCRTACERMASRTVTRERRPARVPVAPVELPELVPGADASGRRAELVRLGVLLRQAAVMLEGQPDAVREKARQVLGL